MLEAAGSSILDTSPLIVGMMGVLIRVVPAPSAKVSISNIVGVMIPTRVSIPSIVEIVNIYTQVIKSMLRLSKISDNAPDGNANRKIGRALAVVIKEKLVMDLEQWTSLTKMLHIIHGTPTYEKKEAIHNAL